MHVYIFVPTLALTTICRQLTVVLCYLRLRFPIVTTILCPQLLLCNLRLRFPTVITVLLILCICLLSDQICLLINTASHQINRLWRVNGRHQPVDNPDTRLLSDYARQVTHSVFYTHLANVTISPYKKSQYSSLYILKTSQTYTTIHLS